MRKHANCFQAAEILLPDSQKTDISRWAVVACDQYTSEPEYWHRAEEIVGDAPSTLRMILPEVWLGEGDARLPDIHAAMERALSDVLVSYPDTMLLLERVQSDGKTRLGLIGAVDLECYDYHKGSTSLIRATEGTVLERIPPRVKIRRGAPLELPHVMLLIDDPDRTVIEPLLKNAKSAPALYDHDLMLGGGHARATVIPPEAQTQILDALEALVTPEAMEARYGNPSLSPLLFAVGDGNHSLATAKAAYEEIKAQVGPEAALSHPARYALAEVVNLHDTALEFEPIYRVVFGADPDALLSELEREIATLHGGAQAQTITVVRGKEEYTLCVPSPESQLAVGTLQAFLARYSEAHPEVTVDYIHGEDSLRMLASREGAVGFLFDGMRKDELFRTVIYDGALPRKTFSMGHAPDKRYYMECRRIK
ncbi:MAG: DUF1015 domain-containing protein [Ruminococcaceae bacterium]|nr:DUF1015 domain-containing protein [Oscillospiraceae bacterium]